SSTEVKTALAETNANLIYFPKPLSPKIDLASIHLTKFFENQEIEIWKIN
ncbi:MAG: hypothetical protein UT58_C0001G0036, partial [Microgenomates group bacterium GW2011_GWC1_39_7b]